MNDLQIAQELLNRCEIMFFQMLFIVIFVPFWFTVRPYIHLRLWWVNNKIKNNQRKIAQMTIEHELRSIEIEEKNRRRKTSG